MQTDSPQTSACWLVTELGSRLHNPCACKATTAALTGMTSAALLRSRTLKQHAGNETGTDPRAPRTGTTKHQAQSSTPQYCLPDLQGSQVQPLAEEHKRGRHQGAGAREVHLETGSTCKAQALSWGERVGHAAIWHQTNFGVGQSMGSLGEAEVQTSRWERLAEAQCGVWI